MKKLAASINDRASILACAWNVDGTRAVLASAENVAKLWDPTTNNSLNVIAMHGAPVKDVLFSTACNAFVTASWDNYVALWDVRVPLLPPQSPAAPLSSFSWLGGTNNSSSLGSGLWPGSTNQMVPQTNGFGLVGTAPVSQLGMPSSLSTSSGPPVATSSIRVPHRPFGIDAVGECLVIGAANKYASTHDMRMLGRPLFIANPLDNGKIKAQTLEHQARCICMFPDKTGYLLGGIEGRIRVQWTTPHAV